MFEFSITNQEKVVVLKNISPSTLPIFYGLVTEDPDIFMFEFDVMCRSYDYTTDPHRLKLFLATLKGVALRWFMGLGKDAIPYWDTMKTNFLEKYQDYCRGVDRRIDDIFRMIQKEDEPLEDYLERFQFYLKKNPQNRLSDESLKLVFLRGVNDDCMDALNLMGAGDISQLPFEDVCKVCRNYLRTFTKRTRGERASTIGKVSNLVSRVELSNPLTNMKEDIISHLASQLDTLQLKKREEADSILTEYCPNCQQRKANCKCRRVASIAEDKSEKPHFQLIEGEDGQLYYVA